jgi:tetratricopeptide (TPR) repeat protein
VPQALIERITERAQGNPFYVEELLNYLHDRGIDPRNAAAEAALELPASLHSLVLSRIDQLPVQQQLTLKVASIIGRQFRVADLLDYYPGLGAPDDVLSGLQALNRLGLTPQDPAEPEASHLFKHRVTQEVAYESIAYAARVELHGRYAEHLERRHAEHLAPLAAQLAHHYERDSMMDKAAYYLRQAGEQAAARFANDEALDYFERAQQCLPTQAAGERFELLLQRESILALQGRHDLRRSDLAELDRLAEALPDPVDAHAQVAVRRAQVDIDTGDHVGARVWARAAIAALESQPSGTRAERLVDALLQEARAVFFGGNAAAARPQLDRALALAREQGYKRGETSVLSLLGLLLWQTGNHDGADELLGQALRLTDPAVDARRQLDILNNLGVVAKDRGCHAQALSFYESAQAIARRIGDRSGQAMLLNNMGDVCLERGDFHQAGIYTEQAARFFHEANEPVSRGLALVNRAEAHRGLGQYAQAHELSVQALTLLRGGGHRHGEAVVLDNLGLIAHAQGQFEVAVARAHDSLAVAREIGSPGLEAGILRNLGRVHTAAGEWTAAAEALAQAAALAQGMVADPLALEVDAALAELRLAECGAGGAAQALALLGRVLPLLSDGAAEPTASLLPMWVVLVAVRVLTAAADARAEDVLAAARRDLQRRSERIPDARTRQVFLSVAEHRALAPSPSAGP